MEDNKQNIDTARRILNFTKWVNQSKTRNAGKKRKRNQRKK